MASLRTTTLTARSCAADKTVRTLRRVRNALAARITAWKATDAANYLASYAPDFQPSGNLTRQAWEAQRRAALSNAEQVDISISELHIDVADQRHAVARFIQTYRSASYNGIVNKTMEWEYIDGKWLISRESSQPVTATVAPHK